jgi:hypothetical protein
MDIVAAESAANVDHMRNADRERSTGAQAGMAAAGALAASVSAVATTFVAVPTEWAATR